MSRIRLVGISAIVLVAACAGLARAEDVSTTRLLIKDNTNPAKRMVLVKSNDGGVQRSEADDPITNGASLHVYSATDDFCAILPSGANWQDTGTLFKYKNTLTKDLARVGDGKLLVKIKAGVGYTLADNGSQSNVNVQVQFGNGTRYCLRCSGNKKDDIHKFLGTGCAAAACDVEPSICDPFGTTTSTSTSSTTSSSSTTTSSTSSTSTSSTSTTLQPPGVVLQGALTPSTGRFNYNLVLGIPGSDAACNSHFLGSHTCTYAELQNAEAAGDLVGRKDIVGTNVTSFWALDSTHAGNLQCNQVVPWDYQTAHTGRFGEAVNLNNGTGVLGPLMSGLPDGVFCSSPSWVGCCL